MIGALLRDLCIFYLLLVNVLCFLTSKLYWKTESINWKFHKTFIKNLGFVWKIPTHYPPFYVYHFQLIHSVKELWNNYLNPIFKMDQFQKEICYLFENHLRSLISWRSKIQMYKLVYHNHCLFYFELYYSLFILVNWGGLGHILHKYAKDYPTSKRLSLMNFPILSFYYLFWNNIHNRSINLFLCDLLNYCSILS